MEEVDRTFVAPQKVRERSSAMARNERRGIPCLRRNIATPLGRTHATIPLFLHRKRFWINPKAHRTRVIYDIAARVTRPRFVPKTRRKRGDKALLTALCGQKEKMRGLIDLVDGEIIAAPTADDV